MKFLDLLKPRKTDEFGIDAATTAIRQLKDRLTAETTKLEALKAAARDAVLDGSDFDEEAILRQEKRIEITRSAVEKAITDASSHINSVLPKIKEKITSLESEKTALGRSVDLEMLGLIKSFVLAVGGHIEDMPRRGHGGRITLPGCLATDLEEVQKYFADLPQAGNPASTEARSKMTSKAKELERLSTITYLQGRAGLEALIG